MNSDSDEPMIRVVPFHGNCLETDFLLANLISDNINGCLPGDEDDATLVDSSADQLTILDEKLLEVEVALSAEPEVAEESEAVEKSETTEETKASRPKSS